MLYILMFTKQPLIIIVILLSSKYDNPKQIHINIVFNNTVKYVRI